MSASYLSRNSVRDDAQDGERSRGYHPALADGREWSDLYSATQVNGWL